MPKDMDEMPGLRGAAEVAHSASALGFELVDCGAGDDIDPGALAYRIGFETSPAGPHGDMIRLRVSEIYRRDGAGWMRIHRHVSPVERSEAG